MRFESPERHNVMTLAAIGVAAHILADVTHEVAGHGGVCLLTGGKITLLTSAFFRNEPLSRLVAAAGPCANLIAGALLWFVFRRKRNWAPAALLFVLFGMAFNFFWAAGYFIYSGVADTGDWAIALGGPPTALHLRAALIALGIVSYVIFTRMVVRAVARISSLDLQRLIFIPYVAAGITACVAAMFYQRDPMAAMMDAGREGFLANIVLLAVPRRVAQLHPSTRTLIDQNNFWIVAAAILFVVFIVVLGRGVTPN
jgi:hypothetical protein